MKLSILNTFTAFALLVAFGSDCFSQEYVATTKPVQTGRSPGVKTKLISTNGDSKTYVLIFSKGDEVVSGLTEFARKYEVKSATYTAIGDATSAKLGFFDYDKKMFKVIPINKLCEVASLNGDIAIYNDKQVAHTHLTVSTEDGNCYGGHLLELFVGPTLEVFVTVYPTPLYKKLDPEFNAGIIDPLLEK